MVIKRRSRKRTKRTLRALREGFGLSQNDIARALGSSQPAVLKTERATDPRLSSIQRYVAAIANSTHNLFEVRTVAVIGDEEFDLQFPIPESEEDLNMDTLTHDTNSLLDRRGDAAASQTAYRLRAWKDSALEQRWLDESAVSMTDDELGDLTDIPDISDDEIRSRLRAGLPDAPESGFGIRITYLRTFAEHITVGDLLAIPMEGRRAAVARVTGGYEYHPDEPDPRMRHRRSVEWLWVGSRDAIPEDIRKVINAPGTICRIDRSEVVDRLTALGQ